MISTTKTRFFLPALALLALGVTALAVGGPGPAASHTTWVSATAEGTYVRAPSGTKQRRALWAGMQHTRTASAGGEPSTQYLAFDNRLSPEWTAAHADVAAHLKLSWLGHAPARADTVLYRVGYVPTTAQLRAARQHFRAAGRTAQGATLLDNRHGKVLYALYYVQTRRSAAGTQGGLPFSPYSGLAAAAGH